VLQLSTTWWNSLGSTSITFNETGTNECIASTTTPVVTCTAEIPEARLYFSNLTFSFSWMTNVCKLLRFQPHYYRRSVNLAYTPPSATAPIDCSQPNTTDDLPDCFGGSAPTLVPGFPINNHIIYSPVESSTTPQSDSETLAAGYTLGTLSNRHTSNDISALQAGNDIAAGTGVGQLDEVGGYNTGEGYLGTTYGPMVEYQFYCADEYEDAQAYIINLEITDIDEDTGNPASNDYATFDHL
jgi:hypothetical protein